MIHTNVGVIIDITGFRYLICCSVTKLGDTERQILHFLIPYKIRRGVGEIFESLFRQYLSTLASDIAPFLNRSASKVIEVANRGQISHAPCKIRGG